MGKLLGRWMKSLIFGKKSSKTKNHLPNDEKIEAKEVPVSLGQLDNAYPSLSVSQRSEVKIEENQQSDNSQDEVTTLAPPNEIISIVTATEINEQNDSDRIREEQAAIDVQAAVRGYLARRDFRTLKGIIRLQALIRGHLVRRQAVSALYCMFRIVKFQALARGRKTRHSPIGVEVQKLCTRVVMSSVGVNSSTQILKLSSNGFACKIVSASTTAIPLHFQYKSNDTNSVLSWLERWSTSQCWQLLPKPKTVQKSNTRRHSLTHVETIASEYDKPIHNLRKISSNKPSNFAGEENPELVLERVKRNLRKVNNPVFINTVQTEPETKTKNTNGNTRKITAVLLSESQGTREADSVITKENKKEDERKKPRRKASLPVNHESIENNEPQKTKRSVPSYMAATVSAKAKLRVQDGPETPVINRRYSLPSLTNVKVSLSPRVQTTGKFKNDRSLRLSRDGSVKMNQVEWRL